MKVLFLLFAAIAAAPPAWAQSSCSSDGQPRPAALMERFINADCATCWTDAQTPAPARGQIALDWIVPGSRGDDAPLSAAASRDGLARLEALGRPTPLQADSVTRLVRGTGKRLRVAHGLAFNGYVGASIELRPARGGPWTAWLALVETVPAGSEGTPVERKLVRNLLQVPWDQPAPSGEAGQRKFLESRAMLIPEGTNADRLRVVGWVEDTKGRIHLMAQSTCVVKP